MNNKNPLDYVYLYNGNNIVSSKDQYGLLPKYFEEQLIRIYVKNLDKYQKIKDLFF